MEFGRLAHSYRFRERTIFGEDGCEVRERCHAWQRPSRVGTDAGQSCMPNL